MNYRLLLRLLGLLLGGFSLTMIPSCLCAVYYGEWVELEVFGGAMGALLIAGGVLFLAGRGASNRMFQRETLALVALGWLAAAFAGALPFVFSGEMNLVDAYFESMSGLTTTGATVVSDIEGLSKTALFWRSFLHFIGGIGIVVLFISVLPYLGVGGKHLFLSESGADPRGFSPRIRETASLLLRIYIGLNLVLTILLMMAGMNLYDALVHAFGTIATGGFSNRQASAGAYDSIPIEIILTVFMLIGGTNFALFLAMWRGDWKAPLRDSEWRTFVGLYLLAVVVITLNLSFARTESAIDEHPPTLSGGDAAYPVGEALRVSSFTVASLGTSTGFITDNFDMWPYFSQMVLVMMMLMGGCAGSTSGGIKVFRILVLMKVLYWRLDNAFRPKTMRPLRLGEKVLDGEDQRKVLTYILLHLTVLGFGGLAIAGMDVPPMTSWTAVLTCMSNAGPGLEYVGGGHDFSKMPDFAKVLLTLFMAMGRLEIVAILVLFRPDFWRHS
ncbi:MAG: hypothetical protein RLZZ303_457 [Candidatus Hydrogenedentota bacterium]